MPAKPGRPKGSKPSMPSIPTVFSMPEPDPQVILDFEAELSEPESETPPEPDVAAVHLVTLRLSESEYRAVVAASIRDDTAIAAWVEKLIRDIFKLS